MPYLADAHICITQNVVAWGIGIGKPAMLNVPGGLHTLANGLAGFAESVSTELFIVNSWHFNMNINAVKQWTGDALLVFGDDSGGWVLIVFKESTGVMVYTI